MATSNSPKIVAVTGASGFIGSHLCQELVSHGYTVRACVRQDTPAKTQHLRAIMTSSNSNQNNDNNNHHAGATGCLEIHVADMKVPGAYDDIFADCYAVCHVAGNFGTDPRWQQQQQQQNNDENDDELSYEQGVYNSYVQSMQYILDSVQKNRQTIRRLIYTSSQCTGPIISQHQDVYATCYDNAYGKGKEDCERLIYNFGREHAGDNGGSIICASSVPCEVLGPILSPIHDTVYPHRLADVLAGHWTMNVPGPCWCVVDVRDVAKTQRFMLEYPHLVNGARFYNGADRPTESQDIIRLLQTEFAAHYKGPRLEQLQYNNEEEEEEETENASDSDDADASDSSSSYGESEWDTHQTTMWSNPETVLGLTRRPVMQTLRDTVESLLALGVVDRPLSRQEMQDYYKVAEMDGEDAEMEYLHKRLLQLQHHHHHDDDDEVENKE